MRTRAWTAIVAATFLVGVGALLSPAANAATLTPVTPQTATSSVAKCGDTGWSAEKFQRPAGINPMTASKAQLKAAALPPRPTDPAMLPIWESFVAHPVADVASCSDLKSTAGDNPGGPGYGMGSSQKPRVTPTDTDVPNVIENSSNWSGKVVQNVDWTELFAEWEVPTATGPDTSRSSQWVGGGSGSSATTPLMQAGTESDPSGYTELFTEVYPQEPEVAEHATTPGHDVAIEVDRTATGASFFLIDESAGWEAVYTWTGTNTTDKQIEYIDERPAGMLDELFEYAKQNTQFRGADFHTTSGFETLTNAPYDRWDMWGCGTTPELADAGGAVSSDTNAFTVTWHNYGIREPGTCQ